MTLQRKNPDVLILGGGVIGLACAYYLLRAGRSVTVLDQGNVGSGASRGNCGTLTPSHATPLAMPGMVWKGFKSLLQADAPLRIAPRLDFALFEWLLQFTHLCNWKDTRRIAAIKAPLLLRSRDLIEQLVREEQLDCEFASTGTLYVYRDEQALDQSGWLPRELAECNVPIERVDGPRCREIEPALNDSIIGGYFNPRDAHLRPDRYSAELARVVRAKGGEIVESNRINGFRVNGDRVAAVVTEQGDFSGRDIVFALGAWSPQLARQLDLRIPIQPGKGYSITYSRPQRCPRLPLVLRERSVCVTSWASGYRLGSTMEFAGYDTSLNRARLQALKRGAAEYLLEPEGGQVVEEWYGWRPMTWDDLPILGRPAHLKNLMLATGHGMLGVTMSAITGALISEMICDKPTSLETGPYSPARFNL